MSASHAVLQGHDGRWALCLERLLGEPPERVWRALTAHDELSDWHPTPFELEPAAGGHVSYRRRPEGPEMPDGRVLEYDPPRLLAYTWADDELRWELATHDHRCALRLTHTFDDRFKAARDAGLAPVPRCAGELPAGHVKAAAGQRAEIAGRVERAQRRL